MLFHTTYAEFWLVTEMSMVMGMSIHGQLQVGDHYFQSVEHTEPYCHSNHSCPRLYLSRAHILYCSITRVVIKCVFERVAIIKPM